MRFTKPAAFVLGICATPVLSGGGTVSSTEPGPPTLAVETTDQMLETMGVAATAKTAETAEAEAQEAGADAVESTAETVEEDSDDEQTVEAEASEEKEPAEKVEVASAPPTPMEMAQQCKTCHGLDGIARIPTAPNIAGSSRQYLETQLKAFRSGKRENEVMAVIAEDLTNAEIKAVAKWYASVKVSVEMPE